MLSENLELLEEFIFGQRLELSVDNTRKITELIGIPVLCGSVALISCSARELTKSCYSFRIPAKLTGAILISGLGYFGYSLGRSLNRNHQELCLLKALMSSITSYHDLLKKNLHYFIDHENQCDVALESATIRSMVVLIVQLHKIVTDLDERRPILLECPSYQPFEDLGNAELLSSERGLRNVKELYKVFLYIQSQFVMRLTVELLLNNGQEIWDQVQAVTAKVDSEKSRHDLQVLSHIERNVEAKGFLASLASNSPSGHALANLKYATSNLCNTMLSQMGRFERISNQIMSLSGSSSDKLVRIDESLTTVESLMAANQCDFHNLRILVFQCLNGDKAPLPPHCATEHQTETADPGHIITVQQNTPLQIDDEFFVLDGQQVEADQSTANDVGEGTLTDKKLKTQFKPVLKQLRNKIDPLNVEMLERENQYLMKQGVEPLPIEPQVPVSVASSTESEDELMGDDLILRPRMRKRPTTKYDENRKFLEEKMQLSVPFRLPPPSSNTLQAEEFCE